ncbi:sel1 repeat family protein [Desulfovibrio sp. OttesenSCG-928-G11]|nr:sel1 repeat family protein [Desulfovibrio sp. OttesenSCG-928-G11]
MFDDRDAKYMAYSIQELHSLAELGDDKAAYTLGSHYEFGLHVPRNELKASFWYANAAEQGNSDAQYSLGVLHGVESLQRHAAEQGCARAQCRLGKKYLRDSPINLKEAARWFQKAAEQGDCTAQAHLGAMHYFGENVAKDYGIAASWLKKAAEGGHRGAQNWLDFLSQDKYHIIHEKIHILFFKWHFENHNQDKIEQAYIHLAHMYNDEKYAHKNYEKAMLAYIKAAKYRNAEALYQIGLLYESGKGVKKDFHKSLQFNCCAAILHHNKAKNKYAEFLSGETRTNKCFCAEDIKKINYKTGTCEFFNKAFSYFNSRLFSGILQHSVITFNPDSAIGSFISANNTTNSDNIINLTRIMHKRMAVSVVL